MKKFLLANNNSDDSIVRVLSEMAADRHTITLDNDSKMTLDSDLDVTFRYSTHNPNFMWHEIKIPLFAAIDLMETMKVYVALQETPKKIYRELT